MALSLWPLVLLALLALLLALEGHPAPAAAAAAPAAPDSHKSLSTALGRELAELLGPAGGGERGTTRVSGGTKAGWTRDKGKAGSASSRLMRELRTEAKRSRGGGGGGWGRGGGGGEGQQQHQRRLLKGQGKKAAGAAAAASASASSSSGKGCFGLKLDRIGSMSGLGC